MVWEYLASMWIFFGAVAWLLIWTATPDPKTIDELRRIDREFAVAIRKLRDIEASIKAPTEFS